MNIPLPLVLFFGLSCQLCGAQFLNGPATGGQVLSPVRSTLLQGLLHAKAPELLFRPDDIISVQVYGVKDYNLDQRVAQNGTIVFPLIGKINVAGRTVQELEEVLAQSLSSSGMVRDPQVTVTAVSRPAAIVTVSGDVAKPGTFPAFGELTLMDYLSQAGGLNETLPAASVTNSPASSIITLVRPSLSAPVDIPLGPDPKASPFARIPLFPGDEVRVSTVGMIYAVGAFKSQGVFPLKSTSSTTVLDLVALAGGIGYEADRKDAHIIRTRGAFRYVLDVDVSKILSGKTADVALQPDDILFVPPNDLKAAIKGGGTGVIVSLASAYLYTH